MVFNTTFNNISVIPWQSVLLVEETRVLWENLFDGSIKYWNSWIDVYTVKLKAKCQNSDKNILLIF